MPNSVDIVSVDFSSDDNGYLGNCRDELDGELTHTSVKDLVDRVLMKLGSDDCIGTLTIVGHGAPGLIVVGGSQSGGVVGERINGGKAEWEAELARLKDRFCPNGKIVLAGCNTGVCDAGAAKMHEIANVVGVKVCGTTRVTYGRDFGSDGFEGDADDLVEVSPGGETPTCLSEPQDDVKKLKKLDKLQDSDVKKLIKPEGIKAISPRKPRNKPFEGTVFSIKDRMVIEAVLDSIDFSQSYDGTGISTVVNLELVLLYDNFIDTWKIVLEWQGVSIVRGDRHMVFPVHQRDKFTQLMDHLLCCQEELDELYRQRLGLGTPRDSFVGRPKKVVSQLIAAALDQPARQLTAKQLLLSPVTVIKGIGPVTAKSLEESLGVRTVADLAQIEGRKSKWVDIARQIRLAAALDG